MRNQKSFNEPKIIMHITYQKNAPLCRLQGHKAISLDSEGYPFLFSKNPLNLSQSANYSIIGTLIQGRKGKRELDVLGIKFIDRKDARELPIINRYFIDEYIKLDYFNINQRVFNMDEEGKIVSLERSTFPVKINRKDQSKFSPGYLHIKGKVIHDLDRDFAIFYPSFVKKVSELPNETINRRKNSPLNGRFKLQNSFLIEGDVVELTREGKEKLTKEGKEVPKKKYFRIKKTKRIFGKTEIITTDYFSISSKYVNLVEGR